jgi:adenine specific DNA methylase Mod
MFQTKVVEEIKTHILCSATFSENRFVYEIMWKNIADPDRKQTRA